MSQVDVLGYGLTRLLESMKGEPPPPPPPANIDRLGIGLIGNRSATLQEHGAAPPEMVSVDYMEYLSKRRAEDRVQREFRTATNEYNERVANLSKFQRFTDIPGLKIEGAKGVARGLVGIATTAVDLPAIGEGIVSSLVQGTMKAFADPEEDDRIDAMFADYLGENQKLSLKVHAFLKPHLLEKGGILASRTVGEDFAWDDPAYWAGGAGEAFVFLISMMIPGMGAAKAAQVAGMGARGIRAAQRAATFITSSALEAGMSYPEFVDGLIARGLSPGEAAQIASGGAVGYGIVAGALETLSIDRLLETGMPRAQWIRVLVAMATEASTEMAQELTNFGFEAYMDIEDASTLGQRLITSGILAAGVSGPVAAVTTRGGPTQDQVTNDDADSEIEHAGVEKQYGAMSRFDRGVTRAIIDDLLKQPELPDSTRVALEKRKAILDEKDKVQEEARKAQEDRDKPPERPDATPPDTRPRPEGMSKEDAEAIDKELDGIDAESRAAPTAEEEIGLPPKPVDGKIEPLDVGQGPNLEAIGQVTKGQALEILDRIGFQGFIDAIRQQGVSEAAIARFRANLGGTGKTFDRLMAAEMGATPEEAERIAGNLRGLLDFMGIDKGRETVTPSEGQAEAANMVTEGHISFLNEEDVGEMIVDNDDPVLVTTRELDDAGDEMRVQQFIDQFNNPDENDPNASLAVNKPVEVTLENGQFIVTDGHHRLEALRRLGERVAVRVTRGIDTPGGAQDTAQDAAPAVDEIEATRDRIRDRLAQEAEEAAAAPPTRPPTTGPVTGEVALEAIQAFAANHPTIASVMEWALADEHGIDGIADAARQLEGSETLDDLIRLEAQGSGRASELFIMRLLAMRNIAQAEAAPAVEPVTPATDLSNTGNLPADVAGNQGPIVATVHRGVVGTDVQIDPDEVPGQDARFGEGQYWSTSEDVARIFAEHRPEGHVVTEEVRLERPFNFDDPDTSTPEYTNLVVILEGLGVQIPDPVNLAGGQRVPSVDFRTIVRQLWEQAGKPRTMFPGGIQFGQALREAGYDGVISTLVSPDFPTAVEIVRFPQTQIQADAAVVASAEGVTSSADQLVAGLQTLSDVVATGGSIQAVIDVVTDENFPVVELQQAITNLMDSGEVTELEELAANDEEGSALALVEAIMRETDRIRLERTLTDAIGGDVNLLTDLLDLGVAQEQIDAMDPEAQAEARQQILDAPAPEPAAAPPPSPPVGPRALTPEEQAEAERQTVCADCFGDVFQAVVGSDLDTEGATIVHGMIDIQGKGRRPHAWIVMPDGSIWDPQQQRTFTAEQYSILNPNPIVEMREGDYLGRMVREGHHGPFFDENAPEQPLPEPEPDAPVDDTGTTAGPPKPAVETEPDELESKVWFHGSDSDLGEVVARSQETGQVIFFATDEVFASTHGSVTTEARIVGIDPSNVLLINQERWQSEFAPGSRAQAETQTGVMGKIARSLIAEFDERIKTLRADGVQAVVVRFKTGPGILDVVIVLDPSTIEMPMAQPKPGPSAAHDAFPLEHLDGADARAVWDVLTFDELIAVAANNPAVIGKRGAWFNLALDQQIADIQKEGDPPVEVRDEGVIESLIANRTDEELASALATARPKIAAALHQLDRESASRAEQDTTIQSVAKGEKFTIKDEDGSGHTVSLVRFRAPKRARDKGVIQAVVEVLKAKGQIVTVDGDIIRIEPSPEAIAHARQRRLVELSRDRDDRPVDRVGTTVRARTPDPKMLEMVAKTEDLGPDALTRFTSADDIMVDGEPLQQGNAWKGLRIVLFHGTGRAEEDDARIYAATADQGTTGPTLGPGRYSALSHAEAQPWAPLVERVNARLESPLVIRSDNELHQAAMDGGFTMEGATQLEINTLTAPGIPAVNGPLRDRFMAAVRQFAIDDGFDSIVIIINKDGDSDVVSGDSIKRLREIFDISTVFEFAPFPESRVDVVASIARIRERQNVDALQGSATARLILREWGKWLQKQNIVTLEFAKHFQTEVWPHLDNDQQDTARQWIELLDGMIEPGEDASEILVQWAEAHVTAKEGEKRTTPSGRLASNPFWANLSDADGHMANRYLMAFAGLDEIASRVGEGAGGEPNPLLIFQAAVDTTVRDVMSANIPFPQQYQDLRQVLTQHDPFDRVSEMTDVGLLRGIQVLIESSRDPTFGFVDPLIPELARKVAARIKELEGGEETGTTTTGPPQGTPPQPGQPTGGSVTPAAPPDAATDQTGGVEGTEPTSDDVAADNDDFVESIMDEHSPRRVTRKELVDTIQNDELVQQQDAVVRAEEILAAKADLGADLGVDSAAGALTQDEGEGSIIINPDDSRVEDLSGPERRRLGGRIREGAENQILILGQQLYDAAVDQIINVGTSGVNALSPLQMRHMTEQILDSAVNHNPEVVLAALLLEAYDSLQQQEANDASLAISQHPAVARVTADAEKNLAIANQGRTGAKGEKKPQKGFFKADKERIKAARKEVGAEIRRRIKDTRTGTEGVRWYAFVNQMPIGTTFRSFGITFTVVETELNDGSTLRVLLTERLGDVGIPWLDGNATIPVDPGSLKPAAEGHARVRVQAGFGGVQTGAIFPLMQVLPMPSSKTGGLTMLRIAFDTRQVTVEHVADMTGVDPSQIKKLSDSDAKNQRARFTITMSTEDEVVRIIDRLGGTREAADSKQQDVIVNEPTDFTGGLLTNDIRSIDQPVPSQEVVQDYINEERPIPDRWFAAYPELEQSHGGAIIDSGQSFGSEGVLVYGQELYQRAQQTSDEAVYDEQRTRMGGLMVMHAPDTMLNEDGEAMQALIDDWQALQPPSTRPIQPPTPDVEEVTMSTHLARLSDQGKATNAVPTADITDLYSIEPRLQRLVERRAEVELLVLAGKESVVEQGVMGQQFEDLQEEAGELDTTIEEMLNVIASDIAQDEEDIPILLDYLDLMVVAASQPDQLESFVTIATDNVQSALESVDPALSESLFTENFYELMEFIGLHAIDVRLGRDIDPAAVAESQTTMPSIMFVSGMQRAPADLRATIARGVPVGVSLTQTLSRAVRAELIAYLNAGGQVFIDNGAFTAFTRGDEVQWDNIGQRWMAIIQDVDPDQRHNIYLVAPDVIGNQQASLQLQEDAAATWLRPLIEAGVNIIIPIHTGLESPASYLSVISDSIDITRIIYGIPFEQAAWTEAAVLNFAKNTRTRRPIHLLGAGTETVQRMRRKIQEVAPGTQVNGDASRVRRLVGQGKGVTERQAEIVAKREKVLGRPLSRSEKSQSRTQAIIQIEEEAGVVTTPGPTADPAMLLSQETAEETDNERLQRNKAWFERFGLIDAEDLAGRTVEELGQLMGDIGVQIPDGQIETPANMIAALMTAQAIVIESEGGMLIASEDARRMAKQTAAVVKHGSESLAVLKTKTLEQLVSRAELILAPVILNAKGKPLKGKTLQSIVAVQDRVSRDLAQDQRHDALTKTASELEAMSISELSEVAGAINAHWPKGSKVKGIVQAIMLRRAELNKQGEGLRASGQMGQIPFLAPDVAGVQARRVDNETGVPLNPDGLSRGPESFRAGEPIFVVTDEGGLIGGTIIGVPNPDGTLPVALQADLLGERVERDLPPNRLWKLRDLDLDPSRVILTDPADPLAFLPQTEDGLFELSMEQIHTALRLMDPAFNMGSSKAAGVDRLLEILGERVQQQADEITDNPIDADEDDPGLFKTDTPSQQKAEEMAGIREVLADIEEERRTRKKPLRGNNKLAEDHRFDKLTAELAALEAPPARAPTDSLFGEQTDPEAGAAGQQGDFGFGAVSPLEQADATDRAARLKKLDDDAGATQTFDWIEEVREVQNDEPAPPGFVEVGHLGLTWHVRLGSENTSLDIDAFHRAIEDHVRDRRKPRGGPDSGVRRAFIDLGMIGGIGRAGAAVGRGAARTTRRTGRGVRAAAQGVINIAILDLIDLVAKSGGKTGARAGAKGRAAVNTTKRTLGQLAKEVRNAMRATGGVPVVSGSGPIEAQKAAIRMQQVEYHEDTKEDSPLEGWGTARIVDLVEGRIPAESPAEQRAVDAIRALINRTGEIFLQRQHLQFHFRTGQWELFNHIPGGRVYPRIMHAEFIAIIGKGQGVEWQAAVRAIVLANAEFIEDIVDELTDDEIEMGLTLEEKFEVKVGDFLQQLREAFLGTGGPSSFHRINAEFTRSIPRFPSHIRINDDQLQMLETHPYIYARRVAENAAHRVGFIEQFGQAIGGWQIINTDTGDFMKHGATKGKVNALFKGLKTPEKNLVKMKVENLAVVATALNQFVTEDNDAEIPDGLTRDQLVDLILELRDQLGVGEETEIVLERVPNIVDDMRKQMLREPGNNAAHFLVMTRVLNGMPAEIPILTAGNPMRRAMRATMHVSSLARAGLLTLAIVPNTVEFLGNIQALNNTEDLMKTIWSVIGGSRDTEGKLHSNLAGMIVTLEAMGAITADLANIAWNPNRPFESASRIFREMIGRFPPRILLEEFQERVAGIAALHKVHRMESGDNSDGTIKRDAIDLAAMMSWAMDKSMRVARGDGLGAEYDAIVRRAPAFMTGGAIRAAEKTRMSNNNVYRMMIAFELYAQVKIRSMAKLMGAYKRAYQARDQKMFLAANYKMARYLFGTALAGQLQYFLLALVTGGWDGLEISWNEMKRHPWKSALESFSYAMFAGPYGSIIRMASGNDGHPIAEQIFSMTLPGFVIDQTVRMFSGAGQYGNMEWHERAAHWFNRMLPVSKVVDTTIAITGFGHSRESLKLDTAIKGYWRWRFNTDRRPSTGDRGSVEDEVRQFKIGMRQAYDARMRWDDPTPGIMKALGSEGKDASSVRRSILGKRLLGRSIAGRKWTYLDTEDLIATIGQNAYEQLLYHDAILTGWAESFKGGGATWAR